METVPEEMLLFQEYDDGKNQNDDMPKMSSYKDKLAQFKAKRATKGRGNYGQQ